MDNNPSRRYICIVAHPDDCEIQFGGTAAKLASAGHAVKFLCVSNGDAGHFKMGGPPLAQLRAGEAQEAARRLGIAETEILANHDGAILPTIDIREDIVRRIRQWRADVVLTHRPSDYHPDHRYTSQLVQDSAYLVVVPNVCRDVPALDKNPVFIYLEDHFQKPIPFSPDVSVAIDDSWDRKLHGMDAHRSQFYEWLPWVERKLETVPSEDAQRIRWLARTWTRPITPAVRQRLIERYGHDQGSLVQRAESFELCEYGSRPEPEELDRLFPL